MTGEEEGTVHVFDRVLMIVDGAESTMGKLLCDWRAKVTGKVISKLEVSNEAHGASNQISNQLK
ncbi:MAG: hypothetical protein IPO31_26830 [Candidatus Obscuribacter sp.]|nr:hypothetical protein [Candidatus Obscuribacter sp.]